MVCDNVTLKFPGRRDLISLDFEITVQYRKTLDRFSRRHTSIHIVNYRLNCFTRRGCIECYQRNQITSTLAVNHRLANQVMFLEHVLEQRGRYFFPCRCDDQLFLATNDPEKTIFIHFPQITGEQPTIIEDLRSFLRRLVVTTEHHLTAHE